MTRVSIKAIGFSENPQGFCKMLGVSQTFLHQSLGFNKVFHEKPRYFTGYLPLEIS